MKEYITALQSMNMDQAGRKRAEEQTIASGITVNDGPVAFSCVPLMVTEEDRNSFDQVIVGIQTILSKMTERYIADPSYRKIFGFSKEMEELICLPCDYPCIIPFGRYDLFYDFISGTYGFCEINTDGSGGMSWNNRITEAVLQNFGDQKYLKEKGITLWDAETPFAEGIIEIWKSSPQAYVNGSLKEADLIPDPLIAIVDFKEEAVMTDFQGIIDGLIAKGVRARFTDMRDLEFDGAQLRDRTDGAVIHGIYRRAVTSVMLERLEECRALIDAVRSEKVVLMGHFRTSLAHSKKVFAAMYRKETREFLAKEEIAYIHAHVPATYILREGTLSEEDLNRIRLEKDSWVLKPEEGFASMDVTCGMDVEPEEWKRLLEEALKKPFILQQFCERYTVPVVRGDTGELDEYPLMLGIFQTGGHAAACYSRAGQAGVIDFSHGCVCVPTAVIKSCDEVQE
ncbi:MAG: hypothetical protein Q4B03_07675 [Lachnospiraceae bacterium]|nr:hypothetical protein [Lachnospiraceae bacterium]